MANIHQFPPSKGPLYHIIPISPLCTSIIGAQSTRRKGPFARTGRDSWPDGLRRSD